MRHGAPVAALFSIAVVAQGAHATGEPDAHAASEAGHAAVPPRPVEYEEHEVGGLRFAYHPSAHERVRSLLAAAPAIRDEVTGSLGGGLLASVEIRIAAMPGEMPRLAPSEVPAYAPSAAFFAQRLIVMSLASPLALEPPDLEAVLRHELAHLALEEALDGRDVPRWLRDGFATHASSEGSAARLGLLVGATIEGRLLPLDGLDGGAAPGSLASAQAADFVRFLLAPSREARFRAFIARVRSGEPFDRALSLAYGADMASIEREVRAEMTLRYAFAPILIASGLVVALVALFVMLRARRRRALAAAAAKGASSRLDTRVLVPARAGKAKGRRLVPRLQDGASAKQASDDRARDGESTEGAGEPRAPRVITIGGRTIEESRELGAAVAPAPGVPKVEHDGKWHTLH